MLRDEQSESRRSYEVIFVLEIYERNLSMPPIIKPNDIQEREVMVAE